MARFTQPGGGEGTPLPQGLGTSSSPTFDKVYTTHNSDGTNVKIGDDAWIGDVDTMNHIAIIGVEDDTQGGIIFGSNETEFISSDGTNLSLTADNDIILNPGSTYAYIGTPQEDGSNRIAKMSDITGGPGANIADFIFTDNGGDSTITLPGDKGMRIEAGLDSDLYITAGDDLYIQTLGAGDDIHLNAADDIRFTTNNENFESETVYDWRMDSEGRFQLPGSGYISNPVDSSGDGYGNDTIHLVPDTENTGVDQYIIIDPTAPNHIHIRAGGAQDYSSAELILGGERAGVHVSDTSGAVAIQSKQEDYSWTYENINGDGGSIYVVASEVAEPDINDFMIISGIKYIITSVNRDVQNGITEYQTTPSFDFITNNSYTFIRDNGNYFWTFDNNGYLSGPAMGGLLVTGILNGEGDLYVQSDQNVIIGGGQTNGEFLNDSSDPDNQIATIGDVTSAQGTGANGEVTRWSPNLQATGLTFTGSGATYPTYNSHYVKNGRMVSFWIAIDLNTVTNFGTGQYKTELPFAPLTGTMNHFQAWANVDPTVNPDIAGHVVLQADHLADTSVLDLHYLKQAGGANSPLMEALFVQGTPATLTTSSKIYINGTYITAE